MDQLKNHPISVSEILRSRSVVGDFIKPTQLIRYEGLSRAIGADVYVKHENHNPTGSFKIRGGVNPTVSRSRPQRTGTAWMRSSSCRSETTRPRTAQSASAAPN
jgi:threonine dehydratase